MDLAALVADLLDDVLAARSACSLDFPPDPTDPGEAAALIRHRLALYDALVEDGWTPPGHASEQADRDRLLLLETDDAWIEALAGAGTPEPGPRRSQPAESAAGTVSEEQLRQAMESRAVIEQAKGIVMDRFALTAAAAWAYLVRTSQQENRKLRVLAAELVESVEQASPNGLVSPDGQGSHAT